MSTPRSVGAVGAVVLCSLTSSRLLGVRSYSRHSCLLFVVTFQTLGGLYLWRCRTCGHWSRWDVDSPTLRPLFTTVFSIAGLALAIICRLFLRNCTDTFTMFINNWE